MTVCEEPEMHSIQNRSTFIATPRATSRPVIAGRRRRDRRGNALVLVSSIIVLLVIIATAYVTRTQAERQTASSIQRAETLDASVSFIRDAVADIVAQQLFARSIDATDPAVVAGDSADSNYPRFPLHPRTRRFNVDIDNDGPDNIPFSSDDDGRPDTIEFSYNFAAYHVVPWTNWPDFDDYPRGIGAPGGEQTLGSSALPILEDNPVGNPGFGDHRWLADFEPIRFTNPSVANPWFGPDGIFGTDDDRKVFTHWRHLTNLSDASNGFRIVKGIDDVLDFNGDGIVGGLVTSDSTSPNPNLGLMLPVEQWLSDPFPANINPNTGITFYNQANFQSLWNLWLNEYVPYYRFAGQAPPNFYRLADLDGDGIVHENGERPQDEFIPGTMRWNVCRYLADADGDGFTDAYWHLVPGPATDGIRQIVAVRIIDNSAMFNVNVATRFDRLTTLGQSPSDLAAVGQNELVGAGGTTPDDTWNTGFFDCGLNQEYVGAAPTVPLNDTFGYSNLYLNPLVQWEPDRWDNDNDLDFLSNIGVQDITNDNAMPLFPNELTTSDERLTYWRLAGSRPFSATDGLTPFTIADEVELRAYHGCNIPWTLTRFERAVNTSDDQRAFLRSSLAAEEASEYLDSPSNEELLRDNRRKVGLFSGARNDEMPPYLMEGSRTLDIERRKIDLRYVPTSPTDATNYFARMRQTLERALVNLDSVESYYGNSSPGDMERSLQLAASYTANIRSYRDEDALPLAVQDSVQASVPPSFGPPGSAPQKRYIGMEAQPYLVEAFVGHAYQATLVPPVDPDGVPYPNSGHYVVLDEASSRATIVAVQIANPHNFELDLSGYRLSLFGQVYDLPNLLLQPATDAVPVTAVFYAVQQALGSDLNFGDQWLDFLDLQPASFATFAPATILQNANALTAAWSVDRSAYDSPPVSAASIELKRRIQIDPAIPIDPANANTFLWVTVDRGEDPAATNSDSFLAKVKEMADPGEIPPAAPLAPPSSGLGVVPYPGIDLGPSFDPTDPTMQPYDRWVQWVRFTRAWGVEINNDGDYLADERNPRFVFADHAVVEPAGDPLPAGSFVHEGNAYKSSVVLQPAEPDTQIWFTRSYVAPTGQVTQRRPTFFDMRRQLEISSYSIADFPDKGWYSQLIGAGPTGSVDDPLVDPVGDPTIQLNFPMQMLQKDRDVDTIGELLYVWLWGHELDAIVDPPTGTLIVNGTSKTFSEFMTDASYAGPAALGVNRLAGGEMIGDPTLAGADRSVPTLPAGLRVLDAFVCDGEGINITAPLAGPYRNAMGFLGVSTPGLINVNTAPIEVMRTLPFMYRLVHEIKAPIFNPRTRVAESIAYYRDRANRNNATSPLDQLPSYGDRDDLVTDMRNDRGIASLGELLLLNQLPDVNPVGSPAYASSWRVTYAAEDPYRPEPPPANYQVESTQVSTDVIPIFDSGSGNLDDDNVAGDAEEARMLFAGMSNMITTRSDSFTVYMKVRSFRQNPVTGAWDATDPKQIVDDSRYVMLVDRGNVNFPSDKPQILYMEKLPK